jgi:5-methylcytosine-specific restriction endonuclease McrA
LSNWQTIRLQILQRDNYACYYCGAVGCPLEVHHKFPREFGGEDTEDNLIAVCEQYHPVAQSWTVDDSRLAVSSSYTYRHTKTIKISPNVHSKLSKLATKDHSLKLKKFA